MVSRRAERNHHAAGRVSCAGSPEKGTKERRRRRRRTHAEGLEVIIKCAKGKIKQLFSARNQHRGHSALSLTGGWA